MNPDPTQRRSGTGILADHRWIGKHGIGRFAAEVLRRIPNRPLLTSLALRHPLDPLIQARNVRRSQCDSFFSPGYYVPLGMAVPFSFVIHDLIHVSFKGETSLTKSIFYKRIVRRSALSAQTVFTVSEFSKREILQWTGLPEERIVVVGNGVTEDFKPDGQKHQPGVPYVLYVGAIRPHKNISAMLKAFAHSREAKSHILMLTGMDSSKVLAEATNLGIASRIKFTGTIPDADLAAIYRGATCLLFPSLYEGFGLPALEAMACGTPAVVSSGGALEEVAGGAAALCDPRSDESIIDALNNCISSSALRSRLTALGLVRASSFSWDKVAARIQASIMPETQHLSTPGNLRPA